MKKILALISLLSFTLLAKAQSPTFYNGDGNLTNLNSGQRTVYAPLNTSLNLNNINLNIVDTVSSAYVFQEYSDSGSSYLVLNNGITTDEYFGCTSVASSGNDFIDFYVADPLHGNAVLEVSYNNSPVELNLSDPTNGVALLNSSNSGFILNADINGNTYFGADSTGTYGWNPTSSANVWRIGNDSTGNLNNEVSYNKTNLTLGAYTLPYTDGAAGQVLQTNGSGTASWQDATTFYSGDGHLVSSDGTRIVYCDGLSLQYDNNNDFSIKDTISNQKPVDFNYDNSSSYTEASFNNHASGIPMLNAQSDTVSDYIEVAGAAPKSGNLLYDFAGNNGIFFFYLSDPAYGTNVFDYENNGLLLRSSQSGQPFIGADSTGLYGWNIYSSANVWRLGNDSTGNLNNKISYNKSNLTLGAYTLPFTDGTAGQVLQTNGSGTASWQNVASKVDTIYRTPGKDSIQYTINGRYHSILDSVGSSSGTSWNLSGNALLNRTNYLGTSDTSQVHIKTKGIDAIVIDSSQNVNISAGNVSYGNKNALTIGNNLLLYDYGGSSSRGGIGTTSGGNTALFSQTGGGNGLLFAIGMDATNMTLSNSQLFINSNLIEAHTSNGLNLTAGPLQLGNQSGSIDWSAGLVFKSTYFPGTTAMKIFQGSGNVGIGTTTDIPSAILNIASTTQGFLMPRLTTTQKNAISSPAEGLQVYDNTLHQPGFYNGTAWISFGSLATSTAWGLTGNSITAGASFLGTTNNTSLHIRTNNTERMVVDSLGNVGIGCTDTKGYKLAVNGVAIFSQAKVKAFSIWPDYVFDDGYKLLPIADLEKYVREKKHLPDVPSADDIKKGGIDLGNSQSDLLKKIEELTLYIIDQNKKLDEQNGQIKQLQQQAGEIDVLQKEVEELKKMILKNNPTH